jgi:hypothetical protein
MKEFKQLRGTRIYLEMPEEPKSLLHLDDESKLAIEAEKMKKWGRLTVYAVGNSVNAGVDEEFHIKEGDVVMIDPTAASKIVKIPLSEDVEVLMLSSFDIAHIWK